MNEVAKDILIKLNSAGFEAYVVGGFVRDYLLKKASLDIDICTSALPEDIAQLWSIKPNFFGGINFSIAEYQITITSYRMDLEYKNGYPIKIKYGVPLEEDLKRRDFTINALCLDKTNNIIDLNNGLKDLETKTLRMIGPADKRIKEDPLRIIRALRLAVCLDFTLADSLKEAIINNKQLIKTISSPKITKEICKIKKAHKIIELEQLIQDLSIEKFF